MDTNPEIMCTLDGPEVAAFCQAGGLLRTTTPPTLNFLLLPRMCV